jgi:ribosomal-protein-alanine N-acetyltransferase
MALILRYMNLSDVYQVAEIEKRTFSDAWPTQSFIYEVAESTYSYMAVLEDSPLPQPQADDNQLSPLEQFISSIDQQQPSIVLGYGGLWNIVDESHISTIASHPDHRGKGYGELLVAGMVQKSINLNASYIVLEVRVGNVVAQQLYKKYGFVVEDVRKKYYRDQEDAFDMRLDLENPVVVERCQQLWQNIQTSLMVDDRYVNTPPPRESR